MESPILIVDDELKFLSLARLALQMAGFHHIRACNDSREALPLLESRPFAAVLLDLQMPYVSGLEILAWIHRHRPRIPVIVITASPSPETVSACRGLGAFDYLIKPVEKNRLLESLRGALHGPGPGHRGGTAE